MLYSQVTQADNDNYCAIYTQFLHTECLFQKFIYFFFNTIIIPDIFLLISITVKPV